VTRNTTSSGPGFLHSKQQRTRSRQLKTPAPEPSAACMDLHLHLSSISSPDSPIQALTHLRLNLKGTSTPLESCAAYPQHSNPSFGSMALSLSQGSRGTLSKEISSSYQWRCVANSECGTLFSAAQRCCNADCERRLPAEGDLWSSEQWCFSMILTRWHSRKHTRGRKVGLVIACEKKNCVFSLW
jgi:hypothetical protein